jgi:hypothetical protein
VSIDGRIARSGVSISQMSARSAELRRGRGMAGACQHVQAKRCAWVTMQSCAEGTARQRQISKQRDAGRSWGEVQAGASS